MESAKTDAAEYRRQIATGLSHLRSVASCHFETAQSSEWLPSTESPGMRDLARSREIGEHPGWSDPLTDVASMVGLLLLAGTEVSISYADRLVAERTSAFTHLVLSRTCIEASANAHWLSEPHLDVRDRIKRGLWYRAHSLREEPRAIASREKVVAEHFARLQECASHYGWTLNSRNNDRVFGDGFRRPNMRDMISQMLVGEDSRDVGRALWGYLSAVTHLTWYGIRETLIPPFPSGEDPLRPTLVGVGSSSDFVNTLTVCLTLMFAKAATAHLEYMGWENRNPSWTAIRDDAVNWATSVIAARAAVPHPGS